MKILISFVLIAGLYQAGFAQDSTTEKKSRWDDGTETLANKKGGLGGFLEMNAMPTFLNGQPALFTGGGLSLVFGHSLNLGFAGYGMVSDIESDVVDTAGNNYFLQTAYGGFTIEPVLFSKKLIHLSFPLLLGIGGTSLTRNSLYHSDTYEDSWTNSEMYFIARTGVNLEINLLRILRLDLGVSYRFTLGHEMQNIQPPMLDGWSGNIGLKLGWF